MYVSGQLRWFVGLLQSKSTFEAPPPLEIPWSRLQKVVQCHVINLTKNIMKNNQLCFQTGKANLSSRLDPMMTAMTKFFSLLEKQSKFPRYNMKCEENVMLQYMKYCAQYHRFPSYISSYIAESQLHLGQCSSTTSKRAKRLNEFKIATREKDCFKLWQDQSNTMYCMLKNYTY